MARVQLVGGWRTVAMAAMAVAAEAVAPVSVWVSVSLPVLVLVSVSVLAVVAAVPLVAAAVGTHSGCAHTPCCPQYPLWY